MPRTSLPILSLKVAEQRYSCHGCGNCCRDFTVQLREEDLRKIEEQKWDEKLGFSPVVEFRGRSYLRQREDGGCVFWMDDGRCRIHAEFGFERKPIACQLFPFSLTPTTGGARMGINFACQSVLENKGAVMDSHLAELKRMAGELSEVSPLEKPPMLTAALRAEPREMDALTSRIDRWLSRIDVDLTTRLDGLTWVTQSLNVARLQNVRGRRLADLLEALFSALPQELDYHPVGAPTKGQMKMLRQGVFARIEDPKIGRVEQAGMKRTAIGQFMRSRKFASGRGRAPMVASDWSNDVKLQDVGRVAPVIDDEQMITLIDDLITRWLRATVLGDRAWGAGFYGWPVVEGLKAMMFNVAAVGWLARFHAAASRRAVLSIEDVRAALGRIDRTSGRAVWLGSPAETWRLKYLYADEGVRRLLNRFRLTS